MAVRLFTDDARTVLAMIKDKIDQGHIDTWSYTPRGDFTHTPASGQWTNKAWLLPKTLEDRLELNIIRPKNRSVEREVYAVYHGWFIEMAIAHVPEFFKIAAATAWPTKGDLV
jgi:hypothetical protein